MVFRDYRDEVILAGSCGPAAGNGAANGAAGNGVAPDDDRPDVPASGFVVLRREHPWFFWGAAGLLVYCLLK